jgi:hypothetical protein
MSGSPSVGGTSGLLRQGTDPLETPPFVPPQNSRLAATNGL